MRVYIRHLRWFRLLTLVVSNEIASFSDSKFREYKEKVVKALKDGKKDYPKAMKEAETKA